MRKANIEIQKIMLWALAVLIIIGVIIFVIGQLGPEGSLTEKFLNALGLLGEAGSDS